MSVIEERPFYFYINGGPGALEGQEFLSDETIEVLTNDAARRLVQKSDLDLLNVHSLTQEWAMTDSGFSLVCYAVAVIETTQP